MYHAVDQKPRKSVTFNNTATMRLELHITDYTDEEYLASFYIPADFIHFKEDARRTVRMMEVKQRIDNENAKDFCIRGLESRTKAGVQCKLKTRRDAVFAVLKAQAEDNDDTEIATVYSQMARNNKKLAYLTGLSDALIVRPEEERKKLDGEMLLDARRIDYSQFLLTPLNRKKSVSGRIHSSAA